jgi:hypothetical protein
MQMPPLRQLLLIDIETVSAYSSFSEVPESWQKLWSEKISWQLPADTTADEFYEARAAIMAEFGKIVCISAGYFREEGGSLQLRVRSFYREDEAKLMEDFARAVTQFGQASKQKLWFTGHNIREFDIPYLCRRMLIKGFTLPAWLDFQAMKPWEVPMIDTMQLWKFGDFKHFTSLNLLASCLGISSPKTDMDGSMVGDVFWKQGDLHRISEYCQQDVITVAQLILRFQGRALLEPNQIVLANDSQ